MGNARAGMGEARFSQWLYTDPAGSGVAGTTLGWTAPGIMGSGLATAAGMARAAGVAGRASSSDGAEGDADGDPWAGTGESLSQSAIVAWENREYGARLPRPVGRGGPRGPRGTGMHVRAALGAQGRRDGPLQVDCGAGRDTRMGIQATGMAKELGK